MTVLPGTWADVTVRGRVVVIDGARLLAPSIMAPEPLGYLRADEGPDGLVIIGQGHLTGHAHLWTFDRGWADLGPTHGAWCIETDGESVWWQTSKTTYRQLSLATGARLDGTIPTHPDGTSQGFLDCTVPDLLWTDAARTRHGVVLPQAAGPWIVGQHPTADAILAVRDDDVRVVVTRRQLYEPRAAYVDGRLIVAVRADDGIVQLDVDPLQCPGWMVLPPAPTPPPAPPEEVPSMIADTLRTLRAGYGATMTNDQCVELLNAAVWAHAREGYFLSQKTSGDGVGRRYDGALLSHDVIMRADGTYWDALDGAGAQSTVAMDPSAPDGRITDPARGPVAAIPPATSPTPPPLPPTPDPPPPASCRYTPPDLGAITAALDAVHGTLFQLAARVEALVALAEQQDRRREELAAHLEDVTVRRTSGWPATLRAGMGLTLRGTVGKETP